MAQAGVGLVCWDEPDVLGTGVTQDAAQATRATTVLLVDDQPQVLQGLEMLLELEPGVRVVGTAHSAEAALARELQPDVVLMDLLMPVMNGITATETICAAGIDTEVLAVTSVLEDNAVIRAIRAGAIGYLLKDTQADELCRAIRAAAKGQVQLSPQAAARLLREVAAPESPETLTGRETEVLRLLARGMANKEIARELSIGDRTVKTHVSSILGKLGGQSRTQAALYAVRIGLVAQAEVGERHAPV